MPELQAVIANGLWILGLSVILATWSYARYMAHQARVKTRAKLRELPYVLVMDLGLLLFVGGMAATEARILGRILWIIIGLIIIVHGAAHAIAVRRESSEN